VAYQGRKKARTSNVLPITDANGFILATTGIIAGHHHDAFDLKDNLRTAFKFIKGLGISIAGSYFNADSAFDTKAARWTCFNHQIIPNIAENKRARKKAKRGHQRFFNAQVYKVRFSSERTFPGLTNLEPCSSVLTVKLPILWGLTLLFLPLSIFATR